MKRRSGLWLAVLGMAALVFGGCPKQPQVKKGPDKREVGAVRTRSGDAFADLEAQERGERTPPPKAREVEDAKPPVKEPAPEPPKPYKEKPVAAVPVNPARAAPDWVNAQPNMPGYYVGIGVSTSHGDEEGDWARARNHGYVELASTMKVHINSVIVDFFKENNLKLYKGDNVTKDSTRQDSSYKQDVQFFVDQTLEGVEIADRWKDEGAKKYWMLVRLSKEELARRIRERLEKARQKAVDYVQAALKAEAAGRLGAAFAGYFKSYLALREYFGGVVEYDVDGDGKPDVLNHEIERAVARLAEGLEWQVGQAQHKVVNGKGLQAPLSLVVAFAGRGVANLPVVFAFQRGKGALEGHVSTEADGSASARVIKVFGDKQAILGTRLDAAALLENAREAAVIEGKFGNDLDRKTGKFYVEIEELSAFVAIEEQLLGKEVSPGSVAADLKSQLHAELGLVFTDSPKGADMEIRGEAVVDRCEDFFSGRRCTARVNVTVTDRLAGRQLFSKKYNVSGNGDADAVAGRDALSKVGKRIAREVIQGLQ